MEKKLSEGWSENPKITDLNLPMQPMSFMPNEKGEIGVFEVPASVQKISSQFTTTQTPENNQITPQKGGFVINKHKKTSMENDALIGTPQTWNMEEINQLSMLKERKQPSFSSSKQNQGLAQTARKAGGNTR